MKHKILWIGLSWLIVAAFVLSSCGPAVAPGEQEEEEEEAWTPYGGTLTIWQRGGFGDPPSPDIGDGFFEQIYWLGFIFETPLIGDLETYGPRGTGEFAFQLTSYIPDRFLKGHLLESWDVTKDKVVWHVRPGIMWQGTNGYGKVMENRELVAQDIVDWLIYERAAPGGLRWRPLVGEEGIYATERYTLVTEFDQFSIDFMYYVGYEDRAKVFPPEMVVAGADKWENQVGTGPWMLKEYIVGSHMTYERNPNYWKTTTINGVEYQLPFLDEIICPIIPDVSTQMSALRTGKLDWHDLVPVTQWETLHQVPGLLSASYSDAGYQCIFNNSEPPYDNVELRRALMIGTDLKSFADLLNVGPLNKHWYPVYTGNPDIYIPLEELPADTRLLYDYNPDLAREMIADIYPDGLETTYTFVGAWHGAQDRAALIKDQWTKIGVEVELISLDSVTYDAQFRGQTYHGALDEGEGFQVANPTATFNKCGMIGTPNNYALYENERVDELSYAMAAELDIAKRNEMIKEATLILLSEVPSIPLNPVVYGHFWWPWLKNYYGERCITDGMSSEIFSYIWLDQDLKADMGY